MADATTLRGRLKITTADGEFWQDVFGNPDPETIVRDVRRYGLQTTVFGQERRLRPEEIRSVEFFEVPGSRPGPDRSGVLDAARRYEEERGRTFVVENLATGERHEGRAVSAELVEEAGGAERFRLSLPGLEPVVLVREPGRCETCRFWDPVLPPGGTTGLCLLSVPVLRAHDVVPEGPRPASTVPGAGVLTPAAYGCVRHEEREEEG